MSEERAVKLLVKLRTTAMNKCHIQKEGTMSSMTYHCRLMRASRSETFKRIAYLDRQTCGLASTTTPVTPTIDKIAFKTISRGLPGDNKRDENPIYGSGSRWPQKWLKSGLKWPQKGLKWPKSGLKWLILSPNRALDYDTYVQVMSQIIKKKRLQVL